MGRYSKGLLKLFKCLAACSVLSKILAQTKLAKCFSARSVYCFNRNAQLVIFQQIKQNLVVDFFEATAVSSDYVALTDKALDRSGAAFFAKRLRFADFCARFAEIHRDADRIFVVVIGIGAGRGSAETVAGAGHPDGKKLIGKKRKLRQVSPRFQRVAQLQPKLFVDRGLIGMILDRIQEK